MKPLSGVLKKSPLEMMKNIIKKKYPKFANVEFQLDQRLGDCPKCQEPRMAEFWVKRETDKEWMKVPMGSDFCVRCEDKQLAKESVQNHLRDKIQRENDQFWNVPPELANETLATYKPGDPDQMEAFQTAVQYLKDYKNGDLYNLVFRGSYGGGKSHLLKGVAEGLKKLTKKIIHNGVEYDVPLTVGFMSMEYLLGMIKGTWGRREGQTEIDIVNAIIDLDFLVIDDLGTESGEWTGKKLFEIINGRQGKATAYSTNFMDMKQLGDRFDINGGKIVSRLHSNTKIVDLITKDMRMEKQRG